MAEVKVQPALSDFLLREGQITPEQLAQAQAEQFVSSRGMGRILVDLGLISEALRIRVLQRRYSYELLALKDIRIDPAVLKCIPYAFAEKHRVAPVRIEPDGTLIVAMEDPSDALVVEAIQRQTGWPVRPAIATIADLSGVLGQYAAVSTAYRSQVAARQLQSRRGSRRWRYIGLVLADLAPLIILAVFVAFNTMGLQDRLRLLMDQKSLSEWELVLYLSLLWGFWTAILAEIYGLMFNREPKEKA